MQALSASLAAALALGLALGLALWTGGLSDPVPALADRPLAAALPTGPLQVTIFGTSLSGSAQIWPEAFVHALGTCRDAQTHLARVTGPGRGSAWAQAQIEAVLATNPDLLLMEFAINDADLRRTTSLAQARRHHLEMMAQLRAARPDLPIVLMTMNGATGARRWIRPWLGAHHGQYAALAARAQTGFIDLHRVWRAPPPGWSRDGLHPDPALAADLIVPELLAYLGAGQDCAQR